MFFSEYSPFLAQEGGSVLDGFKKKSTLGDFWNPGAPLMAVDMFVHSELDEEGFLKIWQ